MDISTPSGQYRVAFSIDEMVKEKGIFNVLDWVTEIALPSTGKIDVNQRRIFISVLGSGNKVIL